MMPTIRERCPTNAIDRNGRRTREVAANAVGSALSSLRMEGRERFVHLPVELDPLAVQALAASERALARNANLRDTFCSRRRLDAGDEFGKFAFEIVEIGQ